MLCPNMMTIQSLFRDQSLKASKCLGLDFGLFSIYLDVFERLAICFKLLASMKKSACALISSRRQLNQVLPRKWRINYEKE